MAHVKFIHTADLHLDTPFKGLTQINSELAARIKDATFKAFETIIDTCITENVDFLLIAGDVFDAEHKSLGAQLKLLEQLQRLSTHDIPTYIICGNHDPLSSWSAHLALPDKVYRFKSGEIDRVTHHKGGVPLAEICGVSYQDKAITENISVNYKFQDQQVPFSIAMLHGNLSGNTAHGNYAPFSLQDLQNNRFDYWALGHIHARQVLQEQFPAIVYPGNPQGRDFGERGEKGCYLVQLSSAQPPELLFIPTDVIQFGELHLDLTGVDDFLVLADLIFNKVENSYPNDNVIVRFHLTGRTQLHKTLTLPDSQSSVLEQLNTNAFAVTPFRFVDNIIVKTQPDINMEELASGGDFVASLIQEIQSIEGDATKANEVIMGCSTEIMNYQIKRELKNLTEAEMSEILTTAKYQLLDHFLID
jgi:DNA repair protein SbcD/Mre11